MHVKIVFLDSVTSPINQVVSVHKPQRSRASDKQTIKPYNLPIRHPNCHETATTT